MLERNSEHDSIEVAPSRLESGEWCHETNKNVGEGDIAASYSADVIAEKGRVRKPFTLNGQLRIVVSRTYVQGRSRAQSYRLMPRDSFEGIPVLYGENDRSSPNGFYHGMTVKYGAGEANEFVLVGPPVTLVPGGAEPKQGDLFADELPSLDTPMFK